MVGCVVCFFFKQKTAYEMRISDWSSDVCSSDLLFHIHDHDLGLRGLRMDGRGKRKRRGKCSCGKRRSLQKSPHQNCVPMLNEKSLVSSPGSFKSALAKIGRAHV